MGTKELEGVRVEGQLILADSADEGGVGDLDCGEGIVGGFRCRGGALDGDGEEEGVVVTSDEAVDEVVEVDLARMGQWWQGSSSESARRSRSGISKSKLERILERWGGGEGSSISSRKSPQHWGRGGRGGRGEEGHASLVIPKGQRLLMGGDVARSLI